MRPGLAIAHHALAGAEDADAQAVEHRPAVACERRYSRRPGRLARCDVADDAFAFGAILQIDAQDRLRAGSGPTRRWKTCMPVLVLFELADLEVEDEALVLEHLGDVDLQLVAGISTAGRSMRLALRMRVSMSATDRSSW